MGWYAIFVATGKEDEIAIKISNILKREHYEKSCEILVPKIIIKERHHGEFLDVTRKMFTGYILICSYEIIEVFYKVKKCRNIYKFLKSGGGFLEIRLEEISNILYMADADGTIGVSNLFLEEDMVKILAGPLCNYIGWIKKIDKHKNRAKVLFKFNGKDHYIELSINIVRKPSEDEVKSEFLFVMG